jgi:ankyrin repeat protein
MSFKQYWCIEGCTPLDWAIACNHVAMVEMLKARGAQTGLVAWEV